jgi:hypothetical protein
MRRKTLSLIILVPHHGWVLQARFLAACFMGPPQMEQYLKMKLHNKYSLSLLSKLPQIRKFTIENIAYLD